ncbi:MAG: polyprenyl synthetase family protein [Acidobacteriota bacterium]|nr:polyprenyl synthetase family protein [Acidobacteriota bacterium]
MHIQQYLDLAREHVDEELNRLLPQPEEFPPSIHTAMRHSVFAGGKRLRPILCFEAGRIFGAGSEDLLRRAAALELIHTYSLIHDDLPALDNDDLRRGKPSCHKAFGEATAILAGDALLTLAFEVLASDGSPPAEIRLQVIREMAHAIGTRAGMVGGQVVDLEASDRKVDEARLEYIHSSKTGALIRMAARAGALYGGAGQEDSERLSLYGAKVGLAFQIADDLLDEASSTEALGKTAGKDARQHKATYPALFGIEESRRMAKELAEEASAAIRPFGGAAARLREIAFYLIERTS